MLYVSLLGRLEMIKKRNASPHSVLSGGISTIFNDPEKLSTGKEEAVNNFFVCEKQFAYPERA